jgi:hypothetical protein
MKSKQIHGSDAFSVTNSLHLACATKYADIEFENETMISCARFGYGSKYLGLRNFDFFKEHFLFSRYRYMINPKKDLMVDNDINQ